MREGEGRRPSPNLRMGVGKMGQGKKLPDHLVHALHRSAWFMRLEVGSRVYKWQGDTDDEQETAHSVDVVSSVENLATLPVSAVRTIGVERSV